MVAAGCLLPLSRNPNLDPALGTRHRAAVGLTEQTDALVLVVSETSGQISLAQGGKLNQNLTRLQAAPGPERSAGRTGPTERNLD